MYYEDFDGAHSWNKRNLIWLQVVGYTQRHLSACYAQAVAQELYYPFNGMQPLRRAFDFRFSVGRVFPVLDGVDLGFDFAAGGLDAYPLTQGAMPASDPTPAWRHYLEQKHKTWFGAFQPDEKPQLLQ